MTTQGNEPVATQDNEPNMFTLRSHEGQILGDTHVTYTTSSISGQPQLQYQDPRRSSSFIGEQIRVQDIGIGSMITVDLGESSPDGPTTTLSLLLPYFDTGFRGSFLTMAISTTHYPVPPPGSVRNMAGILGPGPVMAWQSYGALNLRGTASFVEF